jgi:ankyrin repeat-rich membrane spanning protein
MFLTDDYFSDVNPRSMRRLMNVIYVMGRLMKAFNMDFSWHHLAAWTNITEQWPLRTTWIGERETRQPAGFHVFVDSDFTAE